MELLRLHALSARRPLLPADDVRQRKTDARAAAWRVEESVLMLRAVSTVHPFGEARLEPQFAALREDAEAWIVQPRGPGS